MFRKGPFFSGKTMEQLHVFTLGNMNLYIQPVALSPGPSWTHDLWPTDEGDELVT